MDAVSDLGESADRRIWLRIRRIGKRPVEPSSRGDPYWAFLFGAQRDHPISLGHGDLVHPLRALEARVDPDVGQGLDGIRMDGRRTRPGSRGCTTSR